MESANEGGMMGLHCVIFGREEAGIVVEKERRGSRDGSSREDSRCGWQIDAAGSTSASVTAGTRLLGSAQRH